MKNNNFSLPTKFVTGASLIAIIATCFSGCTTFRTSTQNSASSSLSSSTEVYKLPSENIVKQKLAGLMGQEGNFMLRDGVLTRLPCPVGQPIVLNINFNATVEQQNWLNESLREFNDLFAVVNPNYKFVCNFSPTEKDLNNKYSIDVQISGELGKESAVGHSLVQTKDEDSSLDGNEAYNCVITLDSRCKKSMELFMGVFKHEFGHVLGFADAYLNSLATTNTIMQNGELFGNSAYAAYTALQPIDAKAIDIAYRSEDNPHSEAYINTYLNSYGKNGEYTYEYAQFGKDYVSYISELKELDYNKFLQSVEQSDYTEEVKEDFSSSLKNSSAIDKKFGSSSVMLGECEKQVNNYSHISLEEGKSIVARKGTTNRTEESSYRSANGLVFIGDLYSGDVYFSLGEYVVCLEYAKDYFSGEIKVFDGVKKLYKATELSQEQYFESVAEAQNEND